MAEFDNWATIYDIVHSGLPDESEFYLRKAQDISGSVLELGCGTGRIAIDIAKKEIQTVGLDLSKPMLDECAAKWEAANEDAKVPHNTLQLVQADMSSFELNEQFPLIIMPCRSFMHLLRFNEQRECLECVAKHLDDDGYFIMNIWKPMSAYIHAFKATLGEPEYTHIDTYQNSGVPGKIEHYHSVYCDEFEQRLVEKHVFITIDEDGNERGRKTLPLLRTWR